ncbi:uncharacterized protein LOC121795411 [Salvia splendens]|uniref:uncharacterized protein LOC121795411 n=1 Tax=Salvia splendens TaxID=180675 RepID=UPI001C25D011|nr:uncharacterized protein LOC121795411 [Salvia splendens]
MCSCVVVHESTVVKSINLPKESNSNPNNSPLPTPTEERSDDSEQGNHHFEEDSSKDTLAGKISSAVAISVGSKGQSIKECLKPGDEDKALSSAITNALQKEEEPKRGKVTLSREVAEWPGTTHENKREGEFRPGSGGEAAKRGHLVAWEEQWD